jgi:hypothetical protein
MYPTGWTLWSDALFADRFPPDSPYATLWSPLLQRAVKGANVGQRMNGLHLMKLPYSSAKTLLGSRLRVLGRPPNWRIFYAQEAYDARIVGFLNRKQLLYLTEPLRVGILDVEGHPVPISICRNAATIRSVSPKDEYPRRYYRERYSALSRSGDCQSRLIVLATRLCVGAVRVRPESNGT